MLLPALAKLCVTVILLLVPVPIMFSLPNADPLVIVSLCTNALLPANIPTETFELPVWNVGTEFVTAKAKSEYTACVSGSSTSTLIVILSSAVFLNLKAPVFVI